MAKRTDRFFPLTSPLTWLAGLLALGGITSIAGWLAPAPARASMVLAMDLPRMTATANRILVAEVLSTSSHWDSQRRRIYTTVEVQVAELWKGAMPAGGRLKFTQLGGSLGDYELKVHGQPVFRSGERTVLFLGGDATRSYVVGMGQGHRPLRHDPASGRWLVDPGDRSAAVVPQAPPSGAAPGARRVFVPAPVEAAVPLDDLRSQVRALLK